MRAELRATVEHLAAIARPSASAGEREAAEWIAARFRDAGLSARIEEERVHGTFWWPLGLLNAAGLAAALLPRRRAGRLLAACAVAGLWDDLDARRRVFRGLLPRRTAYNVTAEAGDAAAERTLVIIAHHDAANGGLIYDTSSVEWFARTFPSLHARQRRWPPLMWGVVIGPLLVALGRRRLGAVWSLGATLAMADIGRTPVVPGANDNAAAVAALIALAGRRYRGVRVLLVSTGAEESNAEGMREWGRRHFPSLPRETTSFVALETLGSGNLTLAEAEGFLVPTGFDPDLKDQAERAARSRGHEVGRGLVNSFQSDGIEPLRAGYPTVLLGALDDLKLPSNYHKPTDVPDAIDYPCVERAVDVLDALIRDQAAPVA